VGIRRQLVEVGRFTLALELAEIKIGSEPPKTLLEITVSHGTRSSPGKSCITGNWPSMSGFAGLLGPCRKLSAGVTTVYAQTGYLTADPITR